MPRLVSPSAWSLGALIAASVLSTGCHRQQASTAPEPAAPPPVAAAAIAPAAAPPQVSVLDLQDALQRAAADVAPSVVSITSARPLGDDVPAFLRPFNKGKREVKGMGSGFILDDEGHILTNNHVVENAKRLIVALDDDREFEATVVGRDPQTDVAVIKIDASELEPASLADSSDVRVGQWVMAAGSPFGLPKTVTAGIVSAVGRGSMGIADYGNFIQTDASVNQGNSGGPLIDLAGRVVGMNTAIASRDGGSNGIGFAIPINLARNVADQLIEHGVVRRGWLGIVMGELDENLAASFDYPSTHGVLVDDIDKEGPAFAGGLRAGDIIAKLDGAELQEMGELRNRIAQTRPGSRVQLEVWRKGKPRKLAVKLGVLPGALGKSPPPKRGKPKSEGPTPLGLKLSEPPARLRRAIGLERGGAMISEVAAGSVAGHAKLQPADVLIEVAGKEVRSVQQARAWLKGADLDRGVRVRVRRGPWRHYAVLKR